MNQVNNIESSNGYKQFIEKLAAGVKRTIYPIDLSIMVNDILPYKYTIFIS